MWWESTRIRKEAEFRPMPMVAIGHKPILWHIMRILAMDSTSLLRNHGDSQSNPLSTFKPNIKDTWNLQKTCRRNHPLAKQKVEKLEK